MQGYKYEIDYVYFIVMTCEMWSRDELSVLESLTRFVCERWLATMDTVDLFDLIDVLSRVMTKSTIDVFDGIFAHLSQCYRMINLNTGGAFSNVFAI